MKEFSTRAACPGSRAAGPRFGLSFGLSFRSCSGAGCRRGGPLPGGGGGISGRACGGGSPSYQILHKSDYAHRRNHWRADCRRVVQGKRHHALCKMHNGHALFRTKQKAPCKMRNGHAQCSCSCRIAQVLCKHHASIVQVLCKYAQRVLCKMTKAGRIVLRL